MLPRVGPCRAPFQHISRHYPMDSSHDAGRACSTFAKCREGTDWTARGLSHPGAGHTEAWTRRIEEPVRNRSQRDSSNPNPNCSSAKGDPPILTKPENIRVQALSGEVAALSEVAKLTRHVTVISEWRLFKVEVLRKLNCARVPCIRDFIRGGFKVAG